jgi:serine/threonine-protein kinase RsbT
MFSDNGPGISDLQKALTDGFSTGGGLGLGLSGARRLSNEFTIDSAPGQGTRIMIARWRRVVGRMSGAIPGPYSH